MLAILYLIPAFTIHTPPAPPRNPIVPRRCTACTLVTRSDVERALGGVVNGGAEEIQGRVSTCDYSAGRAMVSVTLQALAARPDLASEIAALKKEIPEGTARQAAGLAAGSFFFDIPGAGTQLHVLIGNGQHLMVSILGFGEPRDISDAAERIARRAISRFQLQALTAPGNQESEAPCDPMGLGITQE